MKKSKTPHPDPYVLPAGGWGRRLHSPWQLLLQDVGSGLVGASDPGPYLEAAVKALFETDPFPMRMTRACVIDADGWVVIGYSTDPKFISMNGHDCWMGSETGFAVVESLGLMDPMDLALAESIARQVSDTEEWWKHDR